MQWTCVLDSLMKLDKGLLTFFWLLYGATAASWIVSAPYFPFKLPALPPPPATYHLLGTLLVAIMVVLFPLMALRSWAFRKRTEKGLNELVRGVSSETGNAFFRSLALHLAKALGAEYVVIGKLSEKNPGWISTAVVYGCGSLQPNFSYRISGTPSEKILAGRTGIFSGDVRRKFPGDPHLHGWEAESFAGTVLSDSERAPIGVLTVIGKQPFKDRKFLESLLQVFAVRAAGELERQKNEDALLRQNRFYQTILNAIPTPVFYKKPSGRYLGCNEAFETFLALPKSRIVGSKIDDLIPASAAERHLKADRELLEDGGTAAYEASLPVSDRRRHVLFHKSIFKNEEGQAGGLVGTLVDITRRKNAEETARYLANFDSLTRLPNQILFTDRLNLELAHSRRLEKKFALFALDLDHFKKINNAFGHHYGDEVLKQVANRLSDCLREVDTVARMGGDSFTLLLPNIRQAENAAQVAQKILDDLKRPFQLESREIFISASIGIAIYPEDGTESQAVLKNADTALSRAKEKGRNGFRFFRAAMNVKAREQVALISGLQKALEKDEFVLHYQPQYDGASGDMVGAEALVRWEHPERGTIPPDQFIPLAEDSNLILPLGDWILHTVCTQISAWRDTGLQPGRIAVNLSAKQFQDPSLYRRIDAALGSSGIDPHHLGLEITESIVMEKTDIAASLLKRLKLRGIHISIDDFGTGHSSLSYIKRFPLDMLKIDRSFIEDLPSSTDDAAIVSAVVTMAHSLGIKILAEGVQTVEQRDFLRGLRCDEFQGFLFSEPLSASAFTRILAGPSTPQRGSAFTAKR